MMPLGGLGMVLLAGFVLKSEAFRDEQGWRRCLYAVAGHGALRESAGHFSDFCRCPRFVSVSFAAHWPVLLALLVLIAVWVKPLARAFAKRFPPAKRCCSPSPWRRQSRQGSACLH